MPDPTTGQSATAGGAATTTTEPAGNAAGTATAAPGGPQSWYNDLPEGVRAEPSLQAFKDKPISAVVESYVSAQKLVGGSIRVPAKDAKPEDVSKFHDTLYGHLGRPADASGYKFERPNVDGVTIDDKAVESFLPVAHKLGLNSKQVEGLLQFQADLTASQAPNHADNFAKCMDTLIKGDDQNPGWGSTTPRYIAVAKRAMETHFHPETVKAIVTSGLGNDPHFVRSMYQVGKQGMEDGLIVGEGEAVLDGKQGAGRDLEKIMGDPKHPYWIKSHPDHDSAVAKVLDLRRYVEA